MDKRDLRILIVEDDQSLGMALDKALSRAGYSSHLVRNAVQALAAVEVNAYQAIYVDCMLPDQNGVDLTKSLRKEMHEESFFVLASGIYKDKSFERDALLKTGAQHFLTKPFDITELVKIFDEHFATQLGPEHPPLHSLLARQDYSIQDRLRTLSNTKVVHGYDLPQVYFLLATQGISGELTLTYDNGPKTSVIGFQNGSIVRVTHPDTESYFGALLVEKGFTSPEEVNAGLSESSPLPIGRRLVEASSLSPHAIEIVQKDQMIIRLSKTICDASIELSFASQKLDGQVEVESAILVDLLADWINSKLSSNWLESLYTPFLEFRVAQGPEYSKLDLLSSHPLLRTARNFLKETNWPYALQEILESYPAEDLLKALHFLFVQRILVLEDHEGSQFNWETRTARLKKMFARMGPQNHFEILGLSQNARPSEITRAYQELAKSLHPDKLPPNAPDDLRQLQHKVFSRISEAHQSLSSADKREAYLKTLEIGLAEDVLKAESLFESGYQMLRAHRLREARKAFLETEKIKGHRSDLPVYIAWALVLEKRKRVNSLELYQKAKSYLGKVPHEDRHSPQYFFVRGLLHELRGEREKAQASFRHAIALDQDFIEAKRELSHSRHRSEKTKNALTEDLSQVVTKFFKNKKTG